MFYVLASRYAGSSPRLRGTHSRLRSCTAVRRFIPAPAGNSACLSYFGVVRPVHPRACGELGCRNSEIQVANGSSPRLRGTLGRRGGCNRGGRFIPAPAGNSFRNSVHSALLSVHPRACGELTIAVVGGTLDNGSSPRLRGTQGRMCLHGRRSRFIPAPAGNSARRSRQIRHAAVHPRACGELWPTAAKVGNLDGSSPRLRGTRDGVPRLVRRRRFIPAPAGNSFGIDDITDLPAVHPRACGELSRSSSRRGSCSGSSPRLRGTQPSRGVVVRRVRFIPAPAGNSFGIDDITDLPAVHPRACGELSRSSSRRGSCSGSSPRLRGTQPSRGVVVRRVRFIPAPAGNSNRLSIARTSRGSSPRLRGTLPLDQPNGRRNRFIPAPAGNSYAPFGNAYSPNGSSPRLRGTRWRARPPVRPRRFIPAPAGNSL